MTAGDQARATVSVALPPDEAFRVFTEEVDLWWRRGRRFRNAPGEAGIVRIEPGPGGRLFESFTVEGTEHVVQMGHTLRFRHPETLRRSDQRSEVLSHELAAVESQGLYN